MKEIEFQKSGWVSGTHAKEALWGGDWDDEHNGAIVYRNFVPANRLLTSVLISLGSGCSGKTTFLKQLRIVYGNGYTEKERKGFKPIIYKNIRRAIARIVEGMEEIGLTFENDELKLEVGNAT